jgi:hypothetical protein
LKAELNRLLNTLQGFFFSVTLASATRRERGIDGEAALITGLKRYLPLANL